jgi:Stage III sporulation protein AB (spore_III_AB).
MLKIVGIIIIIFSSTGLGVTFANDIKKRVEHMKILKKMVIMLDGEIKYANSPLAEAFSNMAKRIETPFSDFLNKISKELDAFTGVTFKNVWRKHIEQDLKQTKLTEKDKEQLKNLGENMGYLDREMQHNSILLYLEQLEKEIEEAVGELQKKTKVYHSLGIMGGLFLAVILL